MKKQYPLKLSYLIQHLLSLPLKMSKTRYSSYEFLILRCHFSMSIPSSWLFSCLNENVKNTWIFFFFQRNEWKQCKTASLCNNIFLLFVVLDNWKKSWELSIFSPWLRLNAPASANSKCLREKASFFQR